MPTSPTTTLTTGRKAERGDVIRYLKRRADQYREEGNPTVRLIIRDLADEIALERHRR
jgi:hypothetical protein